ncbi:hypothetical protein [Neobacillus sp. Marseille-QA0830]
MRVLNTQSRPEVCYSNISLIKKALLQNPGNVLPYPEIVLYLKKNWMNLNSTTEEIERIVNLALFAPKSYFKEVEEGLWGIKDEVDPRLTHIFTYMDQRKIPLKIADMRTRLRVYESEDTLFQLLQSDIRFSQIDHTAYWVLSEWVIINDLVYDYLYNIEILKMDREKVIDKVVQKNNLPRNKVVFLPQFDHRFVFSGNLVAIKRMEEVHTLGQTEEKIEIPIEISEEIGRLSYKIIHYIRESKKEITVSELVLQFFNVNPADASFPIYQAAIHDLLQVIPEITQTQGDTWIYHENAPDFQLDKKAKVYYAVKNSVPTIQNADALKTAQNQPAMENRNKEKPEDNQARAMEHEDRKYAYHTISYYDRIKGYFIIPNALIQSSILFRQNDHGKVTAQHEEFCYEWFWEKSGGKFYFYGDGVMDFLADFLIEPGHKLRFEIDKQVMYLMKVSVAGFDERYASEQQRYLDIGRIVEESQSVNKSIFSLMCETLAIHPSGLHWSVLQDKITEKRSTTKNTITNLLSRNECFEQVEGKKGYWRLNISKLSRYYTNEENQEMSEPVETVPEIPIVEEEKPESLGEDTHHLVDREPKQEETIPEDLSGLTQLITEDLILTIEEKIKQISLVEGNFKAVVSEMVKDEFLKGNLPAIEELYRLLEPHIQFFNKVRPFAEPTESVEPNQQETAIDKKQWLNTLLQSLNDFHSNLTTYKDLLTIKQSECENKLHDLVKDTSVSFLDRKNQMLSLMEEQEKIKNLVDVLTTLAS